MSLLKSTHKVVKGSNRKRHTTIKSYLFTFATLLAFIFSPFIQTVHATECPDLKVIFIRGSGAPRYDNQDYQEFKRALETKLQTASLKYEFDDLDYPAIGVADENIGIGVGALISGGKSYSFGESVKKGKTKLISIINNNSCKNTKYVIGGYSQGAMVLSGSLDILRSDRIIYAATFGDPKIFLPEGAGLLPAACKGSNLSDYRIYVPDCFAYKGLLGAKEPYASSDYLGKLGTWCNKYDIFCSSHFNIESHTSYTEDKLYEDASKLIFSKIAEAFSFKNDYTSPHDTAIMIDSTGSMGKIIEQYKAEALQLAEKTLNSGGRVALFDYRDLGDGYNPVERCSFKTCTIESFKAGLDSIRVGGGGDAPESLLSSSLQVMRRLDWRLGSTKSLVILTDAGYHSPDLDGTTFYDVQALSKKIDPVNFYIITTAKNVDAYQSLADATDGKVVSTVDDLSELTNTIMERFDSLPRVEEDPLENVGTIPNLAILGSESFSDTEQQISFTTEADKVLVVLNDTILGITDEREITLTDLDKTRPNLVTLIPLHSNLRGDPVSLEIEKEQSSSFDKQNIISQPSAIPKAPNTGRQ